MASLEEQAVSDEIRRPGFLDGVDGPIRQLRHWFRYKNCRQQSDVPRQVALELFHQRWQEVPEMRPDSRVKTSKRVSMQRHVRCFRVGMSKLHRALEMWQDIQDLVEQVVNHSIYHRSCVCRPPLFEVRWPYPDLDAYYVRLSVSFWR